jgi:hypothetical protein
MNVRSIPFFAACAAVTFWASQPASAAALMDVQFAGASA